MTKTHVQKWKDEIVGYRKQCQNILKLSKNIRYAGVINIFGRTLAGIIQPDVKPLIKSQDVKNEFFTISTLISMRNKTSKDVGKLEHVILQHKKVTIVILQKNKMTYYVSIDKKEKDLEKIISLIKKTI